MDGIRLHGRAAPCGSSTNMASRGSGASLSSADLLNQALSEEEEPTTTNFPSFEASQFLPERSVHSFLASKASPRNCNPSGQQYSKYPSRFTKCQAHTLHQPSLHLREVSPGVAIFGAASCRMVVDVERSLSREMKPRRRSPVGAITIRGLTDSQAR